jgi:hypothetical protein
MNSNIANINVIHAPLLDQGIPVFFRRPVSKKRRIIKKWKNRKENWRYEKCADAYMLGKQNTVVVSSAMLHELRKLKVDYNDVDTLRLSL